MVKRYELIMFWLMAVTLLAACAGSTSLEAVSSAELTGLTVRNQAGEPLAAVEDAIMDLDSGQIRYLILELEPDGFTFTKAAFTPYTAFRTAVPLSVIERDTDSDDVLLTINEELLIDAPQITAVEDWTAIIDAYWQENLD